MLDAADSSSYHIYTDGSFTPRPDTSGSAAVITHQGRTVAELTAHTGSSTNNLCNFNITQMGASACGQRTTCNTLPFLH